jgi:predicted nuclease of restriction endonuclease-like (RecB) superfamily
MAARSKPRSLAVKRTASVSPLLKDIRELILSAQEHVARAVDSGLVTLYWHIGRRIHQNVLAEKRAEYGEEIVAALGRQLEVEFGRGFTAKNLHRMVQFAAVFLDEKIVAALRRQLGWTHFRMLIPLQDALKRDFYAEMCRIENWSTRTLEQKIKGMLYERTAISKKPDKLIRQELAALRKEDKLTPALVFRDPYVLDFLGLKDTYAEKDVEAAILREVENFILELGAGFAFLERQKRMQIGSKDYYLDLLFYHRRLRRLVAIELKIGDFEAADKGQMELYLNWLKKHAAEPGEEEPLGLILCAGKDDEHVELLEPAKKGIHIAAFWTKLLPKKQLERKLHQAVKRARARLEQNSIA